MKHIIKGAEPECLAQYRQGANRNWQPSYDDLRSDQKNTIKKALMVEQGYICCYCERELEQEDSHIEHFIPQSHSRCDPLDYSNMLCSCVKERKKGDTLHCGVKKGNWYDETLLISPLDSDCEKKFLYTDDGRIKPRVKNDDAAKTTIEKLGLNCQKLIEERKEVLDVMIDDDLTDEELVSFIDKYLAKKNGKFNQFWTMVSSKRTEYCK
ncbi:MAG: TIGR02646 family protein [Oxalobacter formigenes]|nr:TIGR02646 family protein [Oxalobacter formigenes]